MKAGRGMLGELCFAAEGLSGTAASASLRKLGSIMEAAPSGRLFGAISTWVVGIGARMRARRFEQEAVRLRAELEAAQTRLARASRAPSQTILPPAGRDVVRA